MDIIGNQPIHFTQGETRSYKIEFPTDIQALVSKVVLSCNELNICSEMARVGDVYVYTFVAETTANYPIIVTTYDITVEWINGDIGKESGIPLYVEECENPCREA